MLQVSDGGGLLRLCRCSCRWRWGCVGGSGAIRLCWWWWSQVGMVVVVECDQLFG